MKRHIFSELQKWKVEPDRKVLLLRGARQVGKTYLIRELGKTFDQYLKNVSPQAHKTISEAHLLSSEQYASFTLEEAQAEVIILISRLKQVE